MGQGDHVQVAAGCQAHDGCPLGHSRQCAPPIVETITVPGNWPASFPTADIRACRPCPAITRSMASSSTARSSGTGSRSNPWSRVQARRPGPAQHVTQVPGARAAGEHHRPRHRGPAHAWGREASAATVAPRSHSHARSPKPTQPPLAHACGRRDATARPAMAGRRRRGGSPGRPSGSMPAGRRPPRRPARNRLRRRPGPRPCCRSR
jgi:hypothetical protein